MTTEVCPTTTFPTVKMALSFTSRNDIAATVDNCRLASIEMQSTDVSCRLLISPRRSAFRAPIMSAQMPSFSGSSALSIVNSSALYYLRPTTWERWGWMMSHPHGLILVQFLCQCPYLLVVQLPAMLHELYPQEAGQVCRVGCFSKGSRSLGISISSNKTRYSGPPAISTTDPPGSFAQSASYTGAAARGHCELVFATGEVCQNSTPSTGSVFLCSFFALAPLLVR